MYSVVLLILYILDFSARLDLDMSLQTLYWLFTRESVREGGEKKKEKNLMEFPSRGGSKFPPIFRHFY